MINRVASRHQLTCALLVVFALLMARGVHAQPQTPTQAFNAYRQALAGATAYSEILPFMESKGRSMIESMPAPSQAKMFELLKMFAGTYSDVAVAKETVTGDTAMLELSGKDPKGQAATGSVPMTKEASGWKVGTEKWSSKPR
ncbi:MAG: hypothetical protein AB7Q29_06720 [Vicinamibacterales bacterium]